MTTGEHFLVCLAEELNEVIECCVRAHYVTCKALRFGADEVGPGEDRDNAGRLVAELADLLGVAELLIEEGVIPLAAVTAKKDKVRHFLEYARSLGAADAGPPRVKCHYCDRRADRTVVWLRDKQQRPARITLPWCGCDLMAALRRLWMLPYQVARGVDYEVGPAPAAPQKAEAEVS